MPDTAVSIAELARPLTTFSEDEQLFRDNIRQFAEERVRPLVKEMDEKQVMDSGLIQELFQLGVMGIEIPEQYGGGGGTFFEAILAVEEISKVDPSVGVLVDVQNTLVINALLRWGTEDQKKKYLGKMAVDTIGAYALSEAGSGSDAFALTTRAVMYGYLLESRVWLRVVLALASIPIAVAANGFRIFGTGLLVQYWDPDKAEGFFHEFSGWLIFVVSLLLLFGVHWCIKGFLTRREMQR